MKSAASLFIGTIVLSGCGGEQPSSAVPAPSTETSTAGERPDFSGIWMLAATRDWGLIGLPSGPEFGNIGASLPGATLPYQPWAAAYVAATKADERSLDPLSHCFAIGPVRSHAITF